MPATTHAITDALTEVRAGVDGAVDRLVGLVYDDLARIARRQLALEGDGHTLETHALVHEAYLRLVDQTRAQWADRVHFYSVAAHVMRRTLVDHARRHRASRRGGGRSRTISLESLDALQLAGLAADDRAALLVSMNDALDRLAALDARQARVVECRFFGGLTEEETAEVLGVTPRTVARDWLKARGWLFVALADGAG